MSNTQNLNSIAYHQGRWDASNGETAIAQDYQYGREGAQRTSAEKSYNKGYADKQAELNHHSNPEGK